MVQREITRIDGAGRSIMMGSYQGRIVVRFFFLAPYFGLRYQVFNTFDRGTGNLLQKVYSRSAGFNQPHLLYQSNICWKAQLNTTCWF